MNHKLIRSFKRAPVSTLQTADEPITLWYKGNTTRRPDQDDFFFELQNWREEEEEESFGSEKYFAAKLISRGEFANKSAHNLHLWSLPP